MNEFLYVMGWAGIIFVGLWVAWQILKRIWLLFLIALVFFFMNGS